MGLNELAARLANRDRIGMTAELADKLRVLSEDAMRGQLLAMSDDKLGPLGVYLLGAYVIDDTDFWSDGEIYWWSIPVLVDRAGKTSWSAISGLPAGAPPHSVGSLEWMTSFSLKDPPLLAVIPPDDEVDACVFRLAFYDDDGALANVPKAMGAGYEVLSGCLREGLSGPDQIITPVRQAIFTSLRAEQDDILIDQDVTLRRGERMRFNAGLVGSVINSMIRVYYFVRDDVHTTECGPFVMHKGQTETLKFPTTVERGGRVALFSRGADVRTGLFGDLTTEEPFQNKVLDERTAITLNQGVNVAGTGPAKLVAYYTPPTWYEGQGPRPAR
jgi:hypothetical protein